jgi:hypothetical protein
MSKTRMFVAALLATSGLLLITRDAEAHHPEIVAETVCSDSGKSLVRVITTAWETEDSMHRYNSDISVAYIPNAARGVPNVPVGSGAFTPENNYSFELVFEVPTSLRAIRIRSTANVNWGPNQEFVGDSDYRETIIDLVEDCKPPVTTTTSTTTTGSTSSTIVTTTTQASTVVGTIVPRSTTTLVPLMATPSIDEQKEAPPAEAIVARPRFTG